MRRTGCPRSVRGRVSYAQPDGVQPAPVGSIQGSGKPSDGPCTSTIAPQTRPVCLMANNQCISFSEYAQSVRAADVAESRERRNRKRFCCLFFERRNRKRVVREADHKLSVPGATASAPLATASASHHDPSCISVRLHVADRASLAVSGVAVGAPEARSRRSLSPGPRSTARCRRQSRRATTGAPFSPISWAGAWTRIATSFSAACAGPDGDIVPVDAGGIRPQGRPRRPLSR